MLSSVFLFSVSICRLWIERVWKVQVVAIRLVTMEWSVPLDCLVESIITFLLFTIFLPPFSSTLLPIELCVLYFSIVSSCGSLWLILNEFESIGLPLPSSCSRLHVLLTSILVFISLHSHLSLYLLLVLCVEISLILCVPYTPIKPAATRFSFCDFENSFYIYTNYLVYPAGTYQPTHVHSFIPPFFIFPLTLSVSQCFQTPGTSAYELERYGYLTWIPLNWTLSYSVLAVVHMHLHFYQYLSTSSMAQLRPA